MHEMLVNWLISSALLLLISYFVKGFEVSGIFSALIAAALVGLANVTIKPIISLFATPLNILTFGLFTFVVNAIVLKIVAAFMPGFRIRGFIPAIIAAVIIAIAKMFIPGNF